VKKKKKCKRYRALANANTSLTGIPPRVSLKFDKRSKLQNWLDDRLNILLFFFFVSRVAFVLTE